MNKKTFLVTAPNGIHARPATKLVNLAMQFESEIFLEASGQEINLKSIMGLMSLGIYKGETIHLSANGEDEKEALAKIKEFLKEENMAEEA